MLSERVSLSATFVALRIFAALAGSILLLLLIAVAVRPVMMMNLLHAAMAEMGMR